MLKNAAVLSFRVNFSYIVQLEYIWLFFSAIPEFDIILQTLKKSGL